jgi:Holliday junction resolvase RusA-like endonuclease
MTTVFLPRPPSLNNIFVNIPGRGRVKTHDYKTWLRSASNLIMAQKPVRVEGEVEISVAIGPRRGDLDNRIKPILDCLVTNGVIDDDKHVVAITARWALEDGAMVTITKSTQPEAPKSPKARQRG